MERERETGRERETYGKLCKTASKLLGNQSEFSQLQLLSTSFLAEYPLFQPPITLRSCPTKHTFSITFLWRMTWGAQTTAI